MPRKAPGSSQWPPPLGPSLAAALLLLSLAGCASSDELEARREAEPAAVAAAVCRDAKAVVASECESARLSDPTSEIAYATCLDYNRRDPRACSGLRQAYEADLRAHLAVPRLRDPKIAPVERSRTLAGLPEGEQYRTAEALYKAGNSDAETFQAALLIPEVRKKIEDALDQRLSDAQLHALIERNRAEAVYWYGYMQRLRPADRAAEERRGG